MKSAFAKRFETVSKESENRRKWSHSPAHDLADEISRGFGEPKRFAMYLGAINRLGIDRSRQVFSDIIQNNCDSPGKLFFWKVHDLTKDDPKPPRPKKVKKAAKVKKPEKPERPKKPTQLPLLP